MWRTGADVVLVPEVMVVAGPSLVVVDDVTELSAKSVLVLIRPLFKYQKIKEENDNFVSQNLKHSQPINYESSLSHPGKWSKHQHQSWDVRLDNVKRQRENLTYQ